jgi:release factor glutamine methyltransferase
VRLLDRASVAQMLAEAGCIAPGAEADELIKVAAGDPVVLVDLVSRRITGEPLAWLTGTVTFCGLSLFVDPGVYVPRSQTESLARRAATLLPPAGAAVDLCTGAGAIAAVMAAAVPTSRVLATELDEDAARCARRNSVEVYEGSLDEPLPHELEHHVDVLTAVVPYVPTDSIRLLPRDVQAFEPRLALDGGADGTDLLVEVARRSTRWLTPHGWLLLELGGDQAQPMERLLGEVGFHAIDVMADEDGDPRAICAHLGSGSTLTRNRPARGSHRDSRPASPAGPAPSAPA